MKIESLQVQVASQRSASQLSLVQTTINRAAPPPAPPPTTTPPAPAPSTQVKLSPEAVAASDNEQALEKDPRFAAVKALYEQITGLKFNDASIELRPTNTTNTELPTRPPEGALTITRREVRTESEQTNFSAQGNITTADGRQIAFDFQLNLKRSQREEITGTVRFGPAPQVKDPLVLNFDNKNSAELTDAKFDFDLNSDGQAESISFVTSNSGFLALDKNADGVINNGRELFGPVTEDGFAELAAFDADQNQVIDENDPVFSQLRIFNKDASGQDQLATLAEKGVGAILLANASTAFELKDGQNQLQGRLRASGVYLRENGGVGSVQQIDLRV